MALVSNDFADETEYLKLLTMMVIVSSCYYEKGIFQQSNELDPKNFSGGCAPRTPRLALATQPIHFLDRSAVIVIITTKLKTTKLLTKKLLPTALAFSDLVLWFSLQTANSSES